MKTRAFTLIELLIVVAIIAILAAIAVPNFLEAQVRSKVSRSKADMRSCATALESYAVDNNHYPPPIGFQPPAPFTVVDPSTEASEGFLPFRLTSPVAYMSSLPADVFEVAAQNEHPKKVAFHYSEQSTDAAQPINKPTFLHDLALQTGFASGSYSYLMFSHGPDLKHQDGSAENGAAALYDPTNGTVSLGDIYFFGPGAGLK